MSRGRGLEEEPRAAWGGEGEGGGGSERSRQTPPKRRGNKVGVRKGQCFELTRGEWETDEPTGQLGLRRSEKRREGS